MIKFRWGDDVVIVMVEDFEKERVKAVTSVSPQTVLFDHKPSDTLHHINRFELVNYIPDLECFSHLAICSNPFSIVENLYRRWVTYQEHLSNGMARGSLSLSQLRCEDTIKALDTTSSPTRMDTRAQRIGS